MLILPAEADESVVSTAMDRITKVISATVVRSPTSIAGVAGASPTS